MHTYVEIYKRGCKTTARCNYGKLFIQSFLYEFKVNYFYLKLAVEVFSQFVRLVLRNSRFEIDGSSENEWLKQTRSNLHVVFEKILKNPDMHWRVKLKLVALIGGIIEDCSSTLEPSLPLLIKKIVQFTTDDCAEVSLAAKERILNLSFPDNNLDSAVRQNLYDIVTCLPRIVTQGSMP